ncbi:MAG: hypothetical protein AAGE59_17925 [Cyanobacteria bacterium P01_F01_bin.86]
MSVLYMVSSAQSLIMLVRRSQGLEKQGWVFGWGGYHDDCDVGSVNVCQHAESKRRHEAFDQRFDTMRAEIRAGRIEMR